MSIFGNFIKEKRLALDLSLREFARQIGEDPSNWSKVEKGILMPPQEQEQLQKIASILQFSENSEDWQKLFDLAIAGAGKLPEYIKNKSDIMERLPVLFRTMENVKVSREDIDQLIEQLRGKTSE